MKQRKPEIRRLATGISVLLQPAVLAAFVLAAWRFGTDVGWTREFVISSGAFSHWQTWIAIAVVLQVAAIAFNRYGNVKPIPKSEESDGRTALKSEFDHVRVARRQKLPIAPSHPE